MSERRYTLKEIDAMREAIRWSLPAGMPYRAEERVKEIEERIRTYMVGGIDPQEVIDAANERQRQEQEFYLRHMAEQQARRS